MSAIPCKARVCLYIVYNIKAEEGMKQWQAIVKLQFLL